MTARGANPRKRTGTIGIDVVSQDVLRIQLDKGRRVIDKGYTEGVRPFLHIISWGLTRQVSQGPGLLVKRY